VDMLALYKRLLIKEQMSIQKVRMKNCLFHLACENYHDGVVSILCIVFNLFFISFFIS
jgi:hypothetical protein